MEKYRRKTLKWALPTTFCIILGIYLTGTERDWRHDKGTGTWKSWGRLDGVHWWSIILKLTEFIIAIKMGGEAILCGWTGRQGWLNPSEQGLTNHSKNSFFQGVVFSLSKSLGRKLQRMFSSQSFNVQTGTRTRPCHPSEPYLGESLPVSWGWVLGLWYGLTGVKQYIFTRDFIDYLQHYTFVNCHCTIRKGHIKIRTRETGYWHISFIEKGSIQNDRILIGIAWTDRLNIKWPTLLRQFDLFTAHTRKRNPHMKT